MEDTDIDLRSVFGLFQRQYRLILITVVAVVAIAGISTFAMTPIYSATALILVDPSNKNLLNPDMAYANSSTDSARIDSEVEIMRSDSVLLGVINTLKLTSDSEFGAALSLRTRLLGALRLTDAKLPTGNQALNQTLGKLRNALSVQRRGYTNVITLQIRSESPDQAAAIANALANTYITDQLASKVNGALASRDILQARITSARQSILDSESSFDSFVANNIDTITSDTGRTDIAGMQSQINQLSAARGASLRTAGLAEGYLAQGDFSSLVRAVQSDALAELDRQRNDLIARLQTAGSGSPIDVDLRAELAAIEERLRTEASLEIGRLQEQVSANQTRETSLRESVRTAVLSSNLSADVLTSLYELQQNAELARTQYQTLLTRVQDLETQATLQIADSRIVSPAFAPSSASFPNTSLILMAALVASLVLGVVLALLYERFVGGFTTDTQLQSALRTRVVATVPRVKLRQETRTLADLMTEAPLSVFAESIRRIRAGIDQSLRHASGTDPREPRTDENAEKGAVVMITSASPNEGKSVTALALARSYALSGRRTLLIDCDLRKPSIHYQLDLEPTLGLLDVLGADPGEAIDLRQIVTKDTLTTATVILGARRSNTPTDQLIGGHTFARLLQAARERFDVIILDTPPVVPVVDGLYIAPFVDVIMLIVRWASTSQSDAKAANAALVDARAEAAEILVVLSQQEATRRSYNNRYGEYYAEPI